ncbi:MAG: exodeoxyribonuclease VII large subunit, partial [Clostridia bacterium]|nr:exodeoxyribonuclease VII large subunit [Clostridia bacterium]
MKTISVTELNKYVKDMISEDGLLSDVSVSGELSNVRKSGNGHYYFTLKEDNSVLRCVLFRGSAFGL